MAARRGSGLGYTYFLLVAATAVVALVGYLGYVFYPRFDLPAGTGATLLVLAAGAGIASFFSPCSFPLLLSMLARPIAAETRAQRGRPFRKAATFAAGLSVGASVFLMGVALAIAAGASTYFDDVTFTSTAGITIRIVVGVLLITLGLIQLDMLPISFRRSSRPCMATFAGRRRCAAADRLLASASSGSAISWRDSAERVRSWSV